MTNCKKKNVLLYKGNRYRCHKGSQKNKKEHNGFCKQCASGKNERGEKLTCPFHYERADDEDDPEPLTKSDL